MTNKAKSTKIVLNCKKSLDYRKYFVTGMRGAIANNGYLYMDFYIDKPSLPEKETFIVEEESLKNLSNYPDARVGVREFEGCLIMDYNTMKAMKTWLDSSIKAFDESLLPGKEPSKKY